MPAIGRAKNQAKIAKCRSNLRQLAIACNTYSHDDEGGHFLPGTFGADDNVEPLASYLGFQPNVFVCPGTRNTVEINVHAKRGKMSMTDVHSSVRGLYLKRTAKVMDDSRIGTSYEALPTYQMTIPKTWNTVNGYRLQMKLLVRTLEEEPGLRGMLISLQGSMPGPVGTPLFKEQDYAPEYDEDGNTVGTQDNVPRTDGHANHGNFLRESLVFVDGHVETYDIGDTKGRRNWFLGFAGTDGTAQFPRRDGKLIIIN
jgi:hypothetical protein